MVATGAMPAAMVTEPRRPPGMVRRAGVDVSAILAGTVRLLWRHWPVLIAIFLAAMGARYWLMKAAVKTSEFDAVLGYLIVLLCPLATLIALVLMLRAVRPSLPVLGRRDRDPNATRPPGDSLLFHLASVLIPFLLVYDLFGLLKEDVFAYSYEVWLDETTNDLFSGARYDVQSRLPFDLTTTVIVAIVISLALRLVLRNWQAKWWPWSGLLAAYVEVVVIALAFTTFHSSWGDSKDWVTSRAVSHWIIHGWQSAAHQLDAFGSVGAKWGDAFAGLDGSLTAVIVLPLAWLTTGAVVYGRQIAAERDAEHAAPTGLERRWARLPAPIRWIGRLVGRDAEKQFGPLREGVSMLLRAGLLPMLLFCLAFLLVNSASEWMWELERLVIGPQDLGTVWMPLSRSLSAINTTVSMTLLVCLLAAAIDRVTRMGATSTVVAATPSGAVDPAEPAPAAVSPE